MQVDLLNHNTLDTESVISILEGTFKHRPDESQGIDQRENSKALCR